MAVIEAIATTYLEADAASVLFDDIPSTYEHLQLRLSTRDTSWNRYSAIYMEDLFMQLGDTGHSPVDTGTNYSYHYMVGVAAPSSAAATGQSNILLGKHPAGGGNVGTAPSSGTDPRWYSAVTVDIFDYANASKTTSISASDWCGTLDGAPERRLTAGLWEDVSAVNAIKFTTTVEFRRGSEFTLYGLNSS